MYGNSSRPWKPIAMALALLVPLAAVSPIPEASAKVKATHHPRPAEKSGLVKAAALASGLSTLKNVPIPKVQNLNKFLKPDARAHQAAIRLGKALFWDMQLGSDGQACASCHFHAGADSRTRNQLSPGLKAGDDLFGNNTLGVPGFPQFAPDYTLTAADFPFHVLAEPEENNFLLREVLFDTNDVASSMGAFAADFTAIQFPLLDLGVPFVDPIFNVNHPSATQVDNNVRRVEPRNTPTVINAVFNHSNFWDGRAHNLFNGVSPIGPLDPAARIWVATASGLTQKDVRIPNSSLASQAVGPPTSNLEMSFFDRPFPLIGRKLLGLVPLGQQQVHRKDSVLGPLANPTGPGLTTSYARLIKQAFQPRYWDSTAHTPEGFTLMEANFTLFLGLAVQLYESTLVSDKTPFDLFMTGHKSALSPEQQLGLLVFLNRGPGRNPALLDKAIAAADVPIGVGNCISCHGGPEFTDAAFSSLAADGDLELIELEETPELVNGLLQVSAEEGLLDNGFSNIGVRHTGDDPGRGGIEGGFPLSFTRQALDPALAALLPPGAELPCVAGVDCPDKIQVDGAFKIPGLRNVELTGPYFHNGGQASLEQVVEFYDRQSDFGDANIENLDRNIAFIALEDEDEDPLVEFLSALTDPRVRNEQAPFDHPQLFVPHGGTFAAEAARIEVPAVGAGGRPAAGLPPLEPFLAPAP